MSSRKRYICKDCREILNSPGFLGRSWCKKCETYEMPIEQTQCNDCNEWFDDIAKHVTESVTVKATFEFEEET